MRQCAFLAERGTPAALAKQALAEGDAARQARAYAFECSLCGLCTAVCTEKLDPKALFLALRRDAVTRGELDEGRYGTILGYEARGSSSLFSYFGTPRGARTVFFPGCTLPGTRPGATLALYNHLRQTIPDLGVVLACCAKPSHDLGRQEPFRERFSRIHERLTDAGVTEVLTACPNCWKIFAEYGGAIRTRTVYEVLAETSTPSKKIDTTLTVHDPCPLRHAPEVLSAVRTLAGGAGANLTEMRHREKRTLCCGEGGSVPFLRPDLAKTWGKTRVAEATKAEADVLLTSCAGCAGFLSRALQNTTEGSGPRRVLHLLDLLFAKNPAKPRVLVSPLTYLGRLWLKRTLQRMVRG